MAHKKYGLRIAGFAFKGLCSLVIIGVIALLAWRIIDRDIVPKEVKTLTPNQKLSEAYEQVVAELESYKRAYDKEDQ